MRLIDHAVLAFNFKRILDSQSEKPDVAFIGYPPIETAFVLAKYLNKREVPFIVDVKDLWPQIFVEKVPQRIKKISRILLRPYFYMGNYVLNTSVEITTISDNFSQLIKSCFSLKYDKKISIAPLVAPISELSKEELKESDSWLFGNGIYKDEYIVISFIGSLTASFDFEPIFFAAEKIQKQGQSIQFVIGGDGPRLDELKERSKNLDNVIITGFVNYKNGLNLKQISTYLIAPYINSKDFNSSLPNKIIDAIQLKKPIISSLKGYAGKIITENVLGITYDGEVKAALYNALQYAIEDNFLKKYTKFNMLERKIHFDFDAVYSQLFSKLLYYGNSIASKLIEIERYNYIAKLIINNNDDKLGYASLPLLFQKPYIVYEKIICQNISPGMNVLELGAGTGVHTHTLVKTGANVIAIDISSESIRFLNNKYSDCENFAGVECDMDKMNFDDDSFDVICCAGSLSYANKKELFTKLHRMLKVDGKIIVVDSLNDSFIYRWNRYFQYVMGNRSYKTYFNMTTVAEIQSFNHLFVIKVKYFGSITWFLLLLTRFMSSRRLSNFSDYFDEVINVKKSAFKFVAIFLKN